MSEQVVPSNGDAVSAAGTKRGGRAAFWTGWVISGLLAALLVMSGVVKLTGGPDLTAGMTKLGLPQSMVLPLAVIELTCVVLFLFRPTAVTGAILLTGYMGGAICTHWRVGDPFVTQIAVAVLVWLAVCLREPRLWTFIPWRW